jgi:phi LC3 family holin
MINWKVRLKNKTFWLAIIPAVILLIQAVAKAFGVQLDLGEVGNNLIDIVNAVFVVLAILGIAVDPTTKGVGDSLRAQGYDKPYDG